MKSIEKLLNNNKKWAKECLQSNAKYFENLSKIQAPHYLWIGCSDARVPANTIVGLEPGEIFVHRNVANQVVPSDLNCLSVIQFAVEFLNVSDIIVCGHYGCGGINGALSDKKMGLIDNWLNHIKNIRKRYHKKLDALASLKEKENLLCELNIRHQVLNVCSTHSVQEAWENGKNLSVHGVVYDLHDGLLKSLDLCISSKEDFEKVS